MTHPNPRPVVADERVSPPGVDVEGAPRFEPWAEACRASASRNGLKPRCSLQPNPAGGGLVHAEYVGVEVGPDLPSATIRRGRPTCLPVRE